jgi:hypothetical protein
MTIMAVGQDRTSCRRHASSMTVASAGRPRHAVRDAFRMTLVLRVGWLRAATGSWRIAAAGRDQTVHPSVIVGASPGTPWLDGASACRFFDSSAIADRSANRRGTHACRGRFGGVAAGWIALMADTTVKKVGGGKSRQSDMQQIRLDDLLHA